MIATSNLSVIPMRATPSDKAEMVNQILFGETFDMLEIQEKWSKVRLHHDNYEGWIDNKQYSLLKEKRKKINATNRIKQLFKKVITPYGSQLLPMGAIHFTEQPNNKNLLQTAKQLLNAPYLWGGRTPMGIDCSGFTQLVFSLHGVQLKRDAYQQATQGKSIQLINAATGDLAFFTNTEGRIIHVGIIIQQKNKLSIIHASGKVRIDILDEHGILNVETKKYTHQLHSIKRIKHA